MTKYFFAILVFFLMFRNMNFYNVTSEKLSNSLSLKRELEDAWKRFAVFYRRQKKKLKNSRKRGFRAIVSQALPPGIFDWPFRLAGKQTPRERLLSINK